MTKEKTDAEDCVDILIIMLKSRGYIDDAHILEQSVRSYATTPSDKIEQILDSLKLLEHKREKFPEDVRIQLEKTVLELHGLLEKANNPMPWPLIAKFMRLVKKSFKRSSRQKDG